jgi:hypothetical protein
MKIRLALIAPVLLGALILQSCGADDSTFTLEVKNDTSQVVIDRQCNITCNQFFTKVRLDPGQSTTDSESPDGVASPDELFSSSGSSLGCLPFRFSQIPPSSVTVRVSQAVPCGNSSGAKETGGHDWPYRKN